MTDVPWAQLDDHFHDNPKVLDAPLPAVGLYAIGLSYCSAQLSDGFIPRSVLVGIRGWSAAAAQLVKRHFWEPAEGGGFRVHDYLEWNKSREQVLADRAAARDRKARSRDRSQPDNGDSSRRDRTRLSGTLHSTPSGTLLNPPAASGADGAAPRADADDPVTLRHDVDVCPMCRLPFTGAYLEHTAAKHKVNAEAKPGNLFGGRTNGSPEAPPPEMEAQFAAMHERLQSLPDKAQA